MDTRILGLVLFGAIVCTGNADQQTDKDDGVALGKTLVGGVRNIGRTTEPNTVPGHSDETLPQTEYYNNQDLSGMQSDASVLVITGGGSESAQYAWDKANEPKLQFSASDPIITNANTQGENALTSPGIVTTTTGSCAVSDVSSDETRIEHCTSWMIPTTHNCNNTLDVEVTWHDETNCPIAEGFNEVRVARNSVDTIYARPYCNPGSGETAVDLQTYAAGIRGGCVGWSNFTVSTDQPTKAYTGVELQPNWFGRCRKLPVFVEGSCVDSQCDYTLTYHLVVEWYRDGDNGNVCRGTPMDLAALGYNSGIASSTYMWSTVRRDCVRETHSMQLVFEKPTTTRTPTVTESWDNACAYLEAQVQQ